MGQIQQDLCCCCHVPAARGTRRDCRAPGPLWHCGERGQDPPHPAARGRAPSTASSGPGRQVCGVWERTVPVTTGASSRVCAPAPGTNLPPGSQQAPQSRRSCLVPLRVAAVPALDGDGGEVHLLDEPAKKRGQRQPHSLTAPPASLPGSGRPFWGAGTHSFDHPGVQSGFRSRGSQRSPPAALRTPRQLRSAPGARAQPHLSASSSVTSLLRGSPPVLLRAAMLLLEKFFCDLTKLLLSLSSLAVALTTLLGQQKTPRGSSMAQGGAQHPPGGRAASPKGRVLTSTYLRLLLGAWLELLGAGPLSAV